MTRFYTGIKTHLKSNILTTRSGETEPAVRVGEPRVSPHTPLLLINIILLILTTTTQQPTHTHTTRSLGGSRGARGGACHA
jgi:hypothetical protein